MKYLRKILTLSIIALAIYFSFIYFNKNTETKSNSIEEKSNNFINKIKNIPNVSEKYLQTLGINNKENLSSIAVSDIIPVVEITDQDLSNFNYFNEKINTNKEEYLVIYSSESKKIAQALFSIQNDAPSYFVSDSCGTIIYSGARNQLIEVHTERGIIKAPHGQVVCILYRKGVPMYHIFTYGENQLAGFFIDTFGNRIDTTAQSLPRIYEDIIKAK